MRIAITGATGFIGQHLVPCLLGRGHEVLAIARDEKKSARFDWFQNVDFLSCDVHSCSAEMVGRIASCDSVIHLAWPNLPNYGELFHIEQNYPASYWFLKSLVEAGAKHLLVTGTCFEYGMQNGCLSEEVPAVPGNSYGVAKDFLRRSLETLLTKFDFRLQWARLFYMYGPGQNPKSLLAQLDSAIARGESVFNMSGGEQLRDFLHVSEVAKSLALMTENSQHTGIYNVCSGIPISVRRLVELRVQEQNASISLNLGHYPYSPHEPLAFWGNNARLRGLEHEQ